MATAKPEKTIRVGGVQIAVWSNKSDNKGTFRSFTIVKNYNDGKGWKQSKSFKASDIQLLQLGLTELLKYLYIKDTIKPKQESEDVPF